MKVFNHVWPFFINQLIIICLLGHVINGADEHCVSFCLAPNKDTVINFDCEQCNRNGWSNTDTLDRSWANVKHFHDDGTPAESNLNTFEYIK